MVEQTLRIAISGLNAASTRVQTAAANIANQSSYGRIGIPAGQPGGPYAAQQTTQLPQTAGPQPGGTRAVTQPVTPAFTPLYAPGSSLANSAGVVAAPNVDLAREAAELITATRAYEANAAVVRVTADLQRELLDIKT